MAKFIRFESSRDKPVYVNPEHVRLVQTWRGEDEERVQIVFVAPDTSVVVKGNVEEVVHALTTA